MSAQVEPVRQKVTRGTSRLTPEVHRTIVDAVRGRNYLETAAAMAGVLATTARAWLTEGTRLAQKVEAGKITWDDLSAHDEAMIAFAADLSQAQAAGEAESVEILGRAAVEPAVETRTTRRWTGRFEKETNEPIYADELTVIERPPDWRAELERLSRRFPSRWGSTSRHEVSGPDGGPIPIEHRIGKVLQMAAEAREAIDVTTTPAEDEE